MSYPRRNRTALREWIWILPVLLIPLVGCPLLSSRNDTGNGNDNQNANVNDNGSGQPLPPQDAEINVVIEGQGSVQQEATVGGVRLSAVPDNGWLFSEWVLSNGQSVRLNPTLFDPEDDPTVTARFVPDPNVADSDGDGFVDAADQCPGTPSGAAVDLDGCAASQRDSDNDGVTDDVDACPDSPFGAAVGEDGCTPDERDSDGDGVPDPSDRCPDTPPDDSIDN
ncbi:MAG: PLDc_N domain-containing protein, partial [Planctomycetota bacterium]